MKVAATGIAWYRREDYPRLLAIFEDADVLPRDYDSWLSRAENLLKQIQSRGGVAVKAIIDPDEFPAWCASKGYKVNAKGRMAFATEFAVKHGRASN